MPSLVERLRAIGLPMGSWYATFELDVRDDYNVPTGETVTMRPYVGWTTDGAKAEAAREAGARVSHVPSRDPRFSGWEITVREVQDAAP